MDEVGSRVKRERTMRGWSQRDLAKRAKVTAETISTVETGQHDPRPSTLRKLADALGVEVRELFEEPALPKAEAPREAGPPDNEESILDLVHNAVRRQHEVDTQALNRTLASEGIPQPAFFKEYENALIPLLLERPPDEVAGALVEFARGRVELEAENTRLKEENARLRNEAEQESVHR